MNGYCGQRDLKARGWTATAIKKFLPERPDATRPNPIYPNAGAPMRFWATSRVEEVEQSKEFLRWRAKSAERRQAARRGVQRRVTNMVQRMKEAEITIVRGWSDGQIRELASRTHGGNYMGDPGPFRWSNRTARNCIRHNLTNYEDLWALCNRGETGDEAYEVLRTRVDSLIDETYPQFRCTGEEKHGQVRSQMG
ncbi:MAG: hypothetical protein KC613_21905 [Myxococcales bacterium]|nr:hypothetical protein [Myxococcales bacterium]